MGIKNRKVLIVGAIGIGRTFAISSSPDIMLEDGEIIDLKTVSESKPFRYERIHMPDPIILSEPSDPKSFGQRKLGIGNHKKKRNGKR